MGCASSAPSSARIAKKQKERRDQMKKAGGYNDVVSNIFEEAGNGAAGPAEGVVSFFAETNFRKLSDTEDYMKSRILDPTRKTSNKFTDKATTWAPDAGDYLEKKLMRDKTRFQTKLQEEKERKDKEKEKDREKEKEKEKKKIKSNLLEVTKSEKKKTKKDKIKSIKKVVKKSRREDDSDNDRSTSPGESLLDALAVVHDRTRKQKLKRTLISRKAAGLATTADLIALAEAKKIEEESKRKKSAEKKQKPEDEIEPLDIASSLETLKPPDDTRYMTESPIGSDSDVGADLKIEDIKIDDSASTIADTSVYETETEPDDIYDDAGISASSVSLDDLLTVASDEDPSDVASISTIADRRVETEVSVDKAPKKTEESAVITPVLTELQEGV